MEANKKVEVTVSNRTIVRILFFVIAIFLGFRFMVNAAYGLKLIFIAFFLSLGLNPAVSWISRKLRLKSRAAATGIAYLVVLGVIISFLSFIMPSLIRQTVDFVANVPQTVSQLKEENSTIGKLVRRYKLEDQIDGLSQNLQQRTKNVRQPVFSAAGRIGSALISILTTLVLTFMMLVEGPAWLKKFWQALPAKDREHRQDLARRMYRVVTGYVNGQVIVATIAASFNFVALTIASTILHADINPVALAGILIFTGLIPLIGNTIGGVIVVLSCLFVSLPLAVVMAIFMVIYQQIENITIQPYIQSKYNELTPLLVFVAALLGVGLGGLLGAVVAIPAAGCLRILLSDMWERRQARRAAA